MSDGQRPRFHLAVPVHDLAAARAFYGDLLGCPEGRSADEWVDFDLYGHQFVAHLDRAAAGSGDVEHRSNVALTNHVDGDAVPVPHFGVLLSPDEWRRLADRLTAAGIRFVIEPHTRFRGEVGEQSTMFLLDPSGNALEFKAFADDGQVFARPEQRTRPANGRPARRRGGPT
jgi:extradiol dioxygenase family protein